MIFDIASDNRVFFEYTAWSNSPDGIQDFTTVYPNENLVEKEKISKLYPAGGDFIEFGENQYYHGFYIEGKKGEVYSFSKVDGLGATRIRVLALESKPEKNKKFNAGTWTELVYEKEKDYINNIKVPDKYTHLYAVYSISNETSLTKESMLMINRSNIINTIYLPSPKDDPTRYPMQYVGVYRGEETEQPTDPIKYKWRKVGEPELTDIGYLRMDGEKVFPKTHIKAIEGLDGTEIGGGTSKTGRRNYLTRTNSGHTNILASETNSFATNLKVENIQSYKIKLTNDKALKENYYRFMTNEFGVLKPNQSYYFNGYLQLGAESNMRFTVYGHTSATAKSVIYQKIVSEEGDFSLNFTLPNFGNLTGITIQVEVINMKGDALNKSTDNISLFNLILALTDGDWTRAIEDFANAEDYIGLNIRVKELEKNGGGGTTTPPDTDTGWEDIQLLGGYKGDDFLKPQYRIKNGWVDFRGNILAVPKDKLNFDIGQIPYEAAPDKLKFFFGVVSHDELKFAKLMLNGDGLLKMLVTQETGDISLDGLTYSSRTT